MFSGVLSGLDLFEALDGKVHLGLMITSVPTGSSGHDLSRDGLTRTADGSCV